MRQIVFAAFTAALFLTAAGVSSAADWATVKGQVVFPTDKTIPKREALKVTQDKDHCLSKGDILDESVIVNPKNRGIKNVVVCLAAGQHQPRVRPRRTRFTPPTRKRKPAEVVIDQPCCMFVPRVSVARVGDTLVVKNSAAINHNFFWDSGNNGSFNVNIPAKGELEDAEAARE